jgi:hypothetical protein
VSQKPLRNPRLDPVGLPDNDAKEIERREGSSIFESGRYFIQKVRFELIVSAKSVCDTSIEALGITIEYTDPHIAGSKITVR